MSWRNQRACYPVGVDALRRDDLERARTTAPGDKLRHALELMEMGLEMQRRKLRAADPTASDRIIADRLQAWMAQAR